MTRNQKRILPIVQANPEGITALEVHKATRISFHRVCAALRKLRVCQQFLYDPFDTTQEIFYNPEELAELLLKHQDEIFAALDQDCDSINIEPLQP